jgi:hypothetical protein
MQDFPRYRKVTDLVDEFDVLRAQCENIGDRLMGLTGLFGVASALTLAIGVWNGEPLFAVGSGFALAAAVGFATSAYMAVQASRMAPRVRRAAATATIHRLRNVA